MTALPAWLDQSSADYDPNWENRAVLRETVFVYHNDGIHPTTNPQALSRWLSEGGRIVDSDTVITKTTEE